MEKNQFLNTGSPRTRQSSSSFSSRKSFLGGSNNAVFKKPAPSVSGRSNTQSILGIRSDLNVVESYGFQLPVLVNEALNFNENVSVMCAPNGWAWAIFGRRLLIWQYKSNRNVDITNSAARGSSRRVCTAQCRELTLPQCDIGHKATLVTVFLSENQQMASCLAVSPTGDARYWPSIAHDGSTVDTNGIFEGQEFDRLLNIQQKHEFLLVTTTCNLVLLQLQVFNGRQVLQHKAIKQTSGFLGGIGRRLSSIFVGVNSSGDRENKFVGITCETNPEYDDEIFVTVLSDRWLQRWRLDNSAQQELMLFEDTEIMRLLRVEFQLKFWNSRVDNSAEVTLHMLDMHVNNDQLYVLAGAVNAAHTPQMQYGIAVLSAKDQYMELDNFITLKIPQFYSATTERDCLGLRFIVCRTHLYVYTDKIIYPLNLLNPAAAEMEAEKIEFHMQDDRILNAAVCGQIPLFFSRTHGLVCVTPSDFDSSDFFNASARQSPDVFTPLSETTLRAEASLVASEHNLHMYQLDPEEMHNELKDEVSQMKAAFIYHLKRNINMSSAVLNDLYKHLSTDAQLDAVNETNQLDRIIITIAEDLAEDIPAADPRWEQVWEENSGYKHAIGSSSSLQILTQLKEKNLALRHFIEFLHFTSIWDKLSAIPSGKSNMLKPTAYIIADVNEKIVGAIALRSLQTKYAKAIEEAIYQVVINQWKEKPRGNLTAQDVFYVHICKFQHIFSAFLEMINERIEAQQQATQTAALINDVNAIILQVLGEVIAFREKNTAIFTPIGDKLDTCENLPWTAMSSVTSMLNQLIEVSVRHGARCANEIELKQRLYLQTQELIDIILDGKKTYLDSLRETEKYNVVLQQFEAQRRDLISILIEEGQYDYAASLAEKYLDFQSLLTICDKTDNQDRFNEYMRRYEDYDFSQFAINWHLRQNRQGEVFERFKNNQAALSQFLRDHPTLSWIQMIFNGDFERSAKILLQLAQNEHEIVQRKKCSTLELLLDLIAYLIRVPDYECELSIALLMVYMLSIQVIMQLDLKNCMLSLSKLSCLAAADADLSEQIDCINSDLKIIDYQEQLSGELLESFGYDAENQKVLEVDEIINLLICEENESATEREFRQALELLPYVEEPYEARQKIWCAVILRDNWIDYDVNNAIDYLENLLFFKLIELSFLMGADFETFLPPMNDLLNSSELSELAQQQAFQYLFKLAYEHAKNTFKKSDDMVVDN